MNEERLLWHNVLTACFGYRLGEAVERQTFYAIVHEATGALNDEICTVIRQASDKGMRPGKDYGRVGTDDVIGWIMRFRANPVAAMEGEVIKDYIAHWISVLRNDPSMKEEMIDATYRPAHFGGWEKRQKIINDILDEL